MLVEKGTMIDYVEAESIRVCSRYSCHIYQIETGDV